MSRTLGQSEAKPVAVLSGHLPRPSVLFNLLVAAVIVAALYFGRETLWFEPGGQAVRAKLFYWLF
ncbi:MAG: hypothetical protein JO331_10380 [Verrucomicrobia bacterium]|nr:hypothetical protein [Verrucomicrobiota bacterium]